MKVLHWKSTLLSLQKDSAFRKHFFLSEANIKTCTFWTKATLLSPMYTPIPAELYPDRQTIQQLDKWITKTPQMVCICKFRAAATPFQLEADVQTTKVHSTIYLPMFKLQHALSRSLTSAKSVLHHYSSLFAFWEVSSTIFLSGACFLLFSQWRNGTHKALSKFPGP